MPKCINSTVFQHRAFIMPTGGIIIDRTLLDLKLEDVEKIITDRMNTSMKHQTYVVIIKDYKVKKVLRYKK